MAMYLLKTEPSTFSYDDLVKAKETHWDGVSNNQALIHLRQIKTGDKALIYHTGDEKAVVGLAEFTSAAMQDPKQPGVNAAGEPKFAVAKIKAVKAAKTPVTLAAIKADARFKDFSLVKISRLSVMPVPADLAKALTSMAGL